MEGTCRRELCIKVSSGAWGVNSRPPTDQRARCFPRSYGSLNDTDPCCCLGVATRVVMERCRDESPYFDFRYGGYVLDTLSEPDAQGGGGGGGGGAPAASAQHDLCILPVSIGFELLSGTARGGLRY